MTIRARSRRHHVRARQRESSRRVIKLPVRPKHGVVALLACDRERRCHVIYRGKRRVEVLLVARNTSSGGNRVILVDMAIGALARRHGVRSCQREPGGCVIEGRRLPRGRVMAGLAGLRESLLRVIGIRSVLVILQVTRYARICAQVVVVVDMAIRTLARRNCVRSREREVHR